MRNKRRTLRIPKYERVRWTRKTRALLGKTGDQRVANLVGAGVAAVARERHRLGIPWAAAAKWTPEILADVGKMPDMDVVRKYRYKVSRSAVKSRRLGMRGEEKAEKLKS